MSLGALPFPRELPRGYAALTDEPRFDAARHFAFVAPERVVSLADLGYDPATIAASPSPVAFAGPFRVLSDEGVALTRDIARRLEPMAKQANRLARFVTGGVYRSRFLRDMIGAPELAAFLSTIAGTPLVAHTMPALQLYVNYAPHDVTRHVDQWHADSIGFDFVLMVTDTAAMKGGAFQVFRGTLDEAARYFATDRGGLIEGGRSELPEHLVESYIPQAGWAIFQQGNLVVHRALRLAEPGERITMVPGFVAEDTRHPDPTNVASIRHWGDPGLYTELARHEAWLARGRLDALIHDLPIDADPNAAATALRRAVADAIAMADLLEGRDGTVR